MRHFLGGFAQHRLATWRQRTIALLCVLALLTGVIVPIIVTQQKAEAWWNASWTQRRKITLDNSATAGGGNLTDFPIRVSLTSSNIDYAKTKAAGADIRFVDSDDTTALSYQIETWNSGGTSELWVKIPTLVAGSSTGFIYMYYNNPAASDAQASASVWSNSFRGVWHINQAGNGTTGEYTDSSPNSNNATGGGGSSADTPAQGTGKIGFGGTFDGTSDYIKIPYVSASFGMTTSISISAWVKRNSTNVYAPIFTKGDTNQASDYNMYYCDPTFICSSSPNSLGFFSDGTSPGGVLTTTQVNDTNWHYVVVTRDTTSNARLYVDGVLDSTQTMTGNFPNNAYDLFIGADDLGTGFGYFGGSIDEVHVSNSRRTDAWFKAEYVSQSNAMNSFGSEETAGGGGGGGGGPGAADAPVLTAITSPSTTTPVFQMRANDATSPDYLRYKIEICATSDCSSIVRTVDQTSSQTGWSGQDTQTSTAYAAGSSTAAVAYIQAEANEYPLGDSLNSSSVTYLSNIQANSLLIGYSRWGTSSPTTLTGCSDTLGNTYVVYSQQNRTASNTGTGMCYAINRQGAGANTITMNLSASTSIRSMAAIEYGGINLNGTPTDAGSQNNGTASAGVSNSVTSNAATTTTNGDLIFGGIVENGTASGDSPGTGFTQRVFSGASGVYMEDRTQPTAGSVAATMTFGTANGFSATMAAFKPMPTTSTLATYTYQAPALSPGTQYWWRAYAIDPSVYGSNTYGAASAIATFTTQGPPTIPTLVFPGNAEGGVSTLPEFRMYASDANGEDVRYKIQVCSVSDCSAVVRTIDQNVSQTGWLSQSSGALTRYVSGQQGIHQYQTPALTANTQYWWRAYAIDPTGSNTYGTSSPINSFTTTNTGANGERITGGTTIKGGTTIGR